MHILVVEPWYGGSHRRFIDGLCAHSGHTYSLCTLPGRHWRWRMDAAAVPLSEQARRQITLHGPPDVVFASDMLDLPSFLALMRPVLAEVPVVLYFHENQLTYPRPKGSNAPRTYALLNYRSALAADACWFNSAFHRSDFLEALPEFLQRFPDPPPPATVQAIADRSRVIPLGMNLQQLGTPHARPANTPPVLLWNQRWAFDKNPKGLLNLLTGLDSSGVDFHLIITGRAAGRTPDALDTIRARFQDRLLHMGFVEDADVYTELLHRADMVVSTAHHEFFGLAVMEAVRCGCHPVLPNRLSYPELIPDRLHDPLLHAPTLYDTPDDALALCTALLNGNARPLPPRTLHEIPAPFDWSTRADAFDDAFAALL